MNVDNIGDQYFISTKLDVFTILILSFMQKVYGTCNTQSRDRILYSPLTCSEPIVLNIIENRCTIYDRSNYHIGKLIAF